tara:strand:- start:1850 stop:2326 length:477 start_codon:yes stop_codon:yes gene_type:complete
MFKKILLTSFLLLSILGINYPSKKENTKLFDYCHCLEKIISSNSIQKRKTIPEEFKSLSRDIAKFGVSQTRGSLTNKVINQYKSSKNSFIANVIPNEFYCFFGYWVEILMPGKFESIFYMRTKNTILELKELKNEIDGLLDNIDSEYQIIRKEFNSFF